MALHLRRLQVLMSSAILFFLLDIGFSTSRCEPIFANGKAIFICLLDGFEMTVSWGENLRASLRFLIIWTSLISGEAEKFLVKILITAFGYRSVAILKCSWPILPNPTISILSIRIFLWALIAKLSHSFYKLFWAAYWSLALTKSLGWPISIHGSCIG